MKEKGFTLIELLAVIVILSVITLITVPMITNVIEESKKKALVSSVEAVLDSTDYFTMSHETGVYEFLFDKEHQGSTIKGEKLEYKGNIDGEGKLYLDKEGNTSICISNDTYYAYKNYNSGIIVGDKKTGNCIVGFDALTNKYVAMLDNGTGNVSNVYSKDEVNNLVDAKATELDTKITNNTNEITNMKSNIEELQNNLNHYALQSELDKTNTNVENLSNFVNQNKTDISNLSSAVSKKLSAKLYIFEQGAGAITLKFRGNIYTRRTVALILPFGQNGGANVVQLGFEGNGYTLVDASTVTAYVGGDNIGMTGGVGYITIPSFGGNWGKIEVLVLDENLEVYV